jgi:hypothetical protein
MKIITSACFGLALAASGFALGSTQAAAGTPWITTVVSSNITKVDDRDRDRCERVRRECRQRQGDRDKEYRECVEREHCG